MKRLLLLFFPAVVAVMCALAWADGEEIQYDPNTGSILPAGRTPAQVERETLDIEFQPERNDGSVRVSVVKVRAQYWVQNPTAKALKLKIGFPAPGGALGLKQAPVLVDGRATDWRLYHYDELLTEARPGLIKALQKWADAHPRAVQLAAQMRKLEGEGRRGHTATWNDLAAQLRAEMGKAKASTAEDVYRYIYPNREIASRYRKADNTWDLRLAIVVTGQRQLLPEARWYVDNTVLDPLTGRPTTPKDRVDTSGEFSILVFPLELAPNGRHRLEVRYQQMPSESHYWGDLGDVWDFNYILRTTRAWDSFGPITVSVTAPAGLVFRSLPKLRDLGASGGTKTYRGVIEQPARNLQITLAEPRALQPRLKVNGSDHGRRALIVNGKPTVYVGTVSSDLPRPAGRRSMEQGVVILTRGDVTVRVGPGANNMLVNGKTVPLPTPLVVQREGSYLPLAVIQALYPDYTITLSYHQQSNTVLLGYKPKTAAPAPTTTPKQSQGE